MRYGKFTVKPDWAMLSMKQFGKPLTCRPCKRAHAVGPFFGEGQAVAPDDFEAGALRITGADLEAGGENQTVQRVFDAVHDDAVAR